MNKSFANEYRKGGIHSDKFIPPRELSECFDVMECLAENDIGETYLLTDKKNGKRFVLKCYRKSETSSENSEAELLRGLSHKGLPKFEAEIDDGETLYALREYVEGISLNEYLEECDAISESLVVSIALELCEVLSYLHSQPAPIIHRDVKPSNIVINPRDNSVKLIDFGISRKYSEYSDTDTTYYGTKKFSPPEQYGFSQTDCRTDIYALGIVLRFILTGSTDGQITDNGFARIVEKCTAFSPKDRYQNADAVKRALIKRTDRTKKKTAISVVSALVLCLAFTAGVMVGSYTDFLFSPITDNFDIGSEPFVFTEPIIEKTVRLMLEISDDQPVLRSDLDNVTQILIIGDEAVSSVDEFISAESSGNMYGTLSRLDDLRMMRNLRVINIRGQVITDLSPLVDCSLLEEIAIIGNPISDLSPLVSLSRLKQIDMNGTDIRDFSPLNEIHSLKMIWIGQNMEQYLDTLSRDDIEVNIIG